MFVFSFYQGDVDARRYTYASETERNIISNVLADILVYSGRYPRAKRIRRCLSIGATSYVVSYFPETLLPLTRQD